VHDIMDGGVDLVLVPDFTTDKSYVFEWQLFFFLSSLVEFGGEGANFPVHVVCIGEPPKWLPNFGAFLDLEIYTRAATEKGGFHNKLLGFDIEPKCSQGLLLDTDIIVLSKLNALPSILNGGHIAAARANGHHLTEVQWIELYQYLGIEAPPANNHYLLVNEKLGISANAQNKEISFKYFNSGIVLFDWSSEFTTRWSNHLVEYDKFVSTHYSNTGGAERFLVSNQPAFATAIQQLENEGSKFVELEDKYHTRWQQLAANFIDVNSVVLFHTVGLFKLPFLTQSSDTYFVENLDFLAWQLRSTHQAIRKNKIASRGFYDKLKKRFSLEFQVHVLRRKLKLLYRKYSYLKEV
jgi:lipopolysaccharide biosynthesis glycosyltransferase